MLLATSGTGRAVFDDDGNIHSHGAAVDIHAHALGEIAAGFAGKHIGKAVEALAMLATPSTSCAGQTRDGLDHAGGKGYAAVRIFVELDVRRIIVAHIADLLYFPYYNRKPRRWQMVCFNLSE